MNESLIDKIKLLRLKTGVGLIGCKKALLKTKGNIKEAVIFLRKEGFSVVLNKKNRAVLSGSVFFLIDEKKKNCIILEVNCETDFVSRSSDFLSSVKYLASIFLNTLEFGKNFNLSNSELCTNSLVQQELSKLIVKFGENIVVRRAKRVCIEDGFLFGYMHGVSGFVKVCSILHVVDFLEDFDLVADVAMQVVAMNPSYLSIADITKSVILNEKKLYLDSFKKKFPDKKDLIINKMVISKLEKFYSDTVLLKQPYVKNSKYNVKDIISNKFKLLFFERFEVGEDI